MYTISRLARQFDLSRSTLLYYDRIGLLRPSGRSRSNYRLYTEDDRRKLARICTYRQTGMALQDIAAILSSDIEGTAARLLESQLEALDAQIARLRLQQRRTLRLLGSGQLARRVEGLDRDQWVTLLRASGMSEEDMMQWHIQFEHLYPDDHHAFLAALGIPAGEIEAIRKASRNTPAEISPRSE
ncbi:MAG: MerR family transcriptional regulator [Desulfobacterales bacterium]|nr:MerR family transcriptional regulator [Desulfobacterales bacterium]